MFEITRSQKEAYQAEFYPELKKNGIYTSNERIPVSISPYMLSLSQYSRLQVLCERIHEAIETLLRCYVSNKEIQIKFPELERYRFLSLQRPPYEKWIHLARFDIVIAANGDFRLIETNCDCPGGIIWYPLMKEAYSKMPLFYDQIQRRNPIKQPIDDADCFIQSLIHCYQKTKQTNELPNITFLTSQFRPILTDMNSLNIVSRRMGVTVDHVPVQDLILKQDLTCWNNSKVDVVYQKFDAYIDSEDQMKPCIFENTPDEVPAYWHGLHKNQFMVFNSFPSAMVAENKRILALLQDPDIATLFTEEQNAAIQELCPRTFTLHRDANLPKLYTHLMTYKDRYVIKRTIDTQGRGVKLGCQCTNSEWEYSIEQAIDRPFVVQEFIPQKKEIIYSEMLEPISVYGDLTMFMIAGKASGLISRSSTDIISNVSRTGNFRPVYVIPDDSINV